MNSKNIQAQPKGVLSHTHREKMTPHSPENEDSAIGALLSFNKDIISRAIEIVDESDFYIEKNREIFKIVVDLFNKNETLDISVIGSEIRRRGSLNKIGGLEALIELIHDCPAPGNIVNYVTEIKKCSVERQILRAAEEMSNAVYAGEGSDINNLVDTIEKKIFDIGQQRVMGDFHVLPSLVDGVLQQLETQRENLVNNPDALFGVPSGLIGLDNIIGGWQKTDLILVAARPGMGKTSLGLNAAHHAALTHQMPVAFFSLEMSEKQLVQRFLAMESKVSLQQLRRGTLIDQDWNNVVKAAENLHRAPIYIDESAGLSVLQIHAKLRRLISEKKDIQLVIIDYLQLLRGNGNSNRVQEVADIGRSLKEMAKDLDLPIIAICQLSRAVEMRLDRVPMLSDLRESGSLEADADIVIFPHRKSYYANAPANDGRGGFKPMPPPDEVPEIDEADAQIIIGKHRNGGLGSIDVAWCKEWATFMNKVDPLDEIAMANSGSYKPSQTPDYNADDATQDKKVDVHDYDEGDPFSDS